MQVGEINTANNIAFKSSASCAASLAKNQRAVAIEEGIKKTMPKSIQAIGKFSKFTGEIPNIIINALGTGLVAPIFIKYNFLSKTDDDTRTYSAWRQPISAILSVATSVAVVLPFNKLIDNMTKNGHFTNLKESMNENKVIASSNFNKPSEKVEDLASHAEKTGEIKYTSGDKTIKLSKVEIGELMNKAIDDNLKVVEANLGRHETEKISKQITRGEFYRNNKTDVKTLLAELKTGVDAAGSERQIEKFFTSKLKDMKKAKAPQEMISIAQDIQAKRTAQAITAKIAETGKACSKFSKFKSLVEVSNEVASKIEVENIELRAEKTILTEMKEAIKNGESLDKIAKRAEKIAGSTFANDVIQKHIQNIGANLKGFKQITGLVLSLAILPVACSMLNSMYPKFMDKFFPELSNKKAASKQKETDTFQKSTQPVVSSAKAESDKKEQEVDD